MTTDPSSDVLTRVREVKGPRPLLSKQREAALTARQRELLDELSTVFDDGFCHVTMADLAAQLNCSLRTLYGLAPRRDELVLLVVDRNLWRTGRSAMAAIEPDMGPIDAIDAYLRAANMAVATTTEAFAHDCASVTATRELNRAHSDYLIDVTRALLDLAVDRGDVAVRDTAAAARVMAGLGAHFASPSALATLATTPKDAADEVLTLLLRGLTNPETPCT